MDNELLYSISELLENKIKQAIEPLANKIDNIEKDLKDVKSEIVKTNLIIENKIWPTIQAIHEGQIGLREKITDVKTTVDEMSETVLALDVMHTKK